MIFYAEKITPRLQYVLEHIFKNILQIDLDFTTDWEDFKEIDQSVKISYGRKLHQAEIYIPQESSILFQKHISKEEFFEFLSKYERDIFTMSFLLLSRYQEYLPFKADIHGRFAFLEDEIFKSLEVNLAHIDRWALELQKEIAHRDSDFEPKKIEKQTLISFDIDRLWKYKTTADSVLKAKYFKHTLKKNSKEIASLKEYQQTGKDPYDVFEFMQEQLATTENKAILFILLGDKTQHDNNINFENPVQAQFLKDLSQEYEMGIHPSYGSNFITEKIEMEKNRLEKIIEKPVYQSRQHFIKLAFPTTYKSLLEAQISEDYSMGFPDHTGFRAGTSHPFFWFDLEKNEITKLKIFPFCTMDVTLKKYMNLNIEEAIERNEQLYNECALSGGIFVPIFHNQNLSSEPDWQAWQEVFKKTLLLSYD